MSGTARGQRIWSVSEHHGSSRSQMSDAAAEARRHAWDRVDPDECESCWDAPERFLAHVYALAAHLLSSSSDEGHRGGNPQDCGCRKLGRGR